MIGFGKVKATGKFVLRVFRKFHLQITITLGASVIVIGLLGTMGTIDQTKPPAAPKTETLDVTFCNGSNSHDTGTVINDKGPRTIYRVQKGQHIAEWVDSPPEGGFNSTAMLDGKAVEVTSSFVDCVRQFKPPTNYIEPAGTSDYFVGLTEANPYEQELWNTGVWKWVYGGDSRYDISNSVKSAFDDTGLRYRIHFEFDPSGQLNESLSGARLTAQCGAEWAAACVGSRYPYYPRNCDAVYNGEAMVTWYSETSRKAVVKHELQHCQTTRNEAYLPGGVCVATNTIMGCGPNSPKDYTIHDDNVWAEAHYPDPVLGAALDESGKYGTLVVWWFSPFPAITNVSPCTRVAIWAGVVGWNSLGWIGIYGSCNQGYQGINVPPQKCIEYYAGAENGESPTWGQNLIRAGNTSCN